MILILVNPRKSTPFANEVVKGVTLVAIVGVLLANVSGAVAEPAEPAEPAATEAPANDAATVTCYPSSSHFSVEILRRVLLRPNHRRQVA